MIKRNFIFLIVFLIFCILVPSKIYADNEISITFEDINLYNSIISSLSNVITENIDESKTIKISENKLNEIKFINLSNKSISNLTGLDKFINLTVLNLNSNSISDITPITKLKNLETLQLYNNKIQTIQGLGALTHLNTLCLTGNNIQDISSISNLNNLSTLYLSQYYMGNTSIGGASGGGTEKTNPITDISPLSDLQNLKFLYLSGLKISNLEPLKQLINLRTLEIGSITITDDDLQNLKFLKNLEDLDLGYNGITNINVLSELPKLKTICLENNNISDISVLKNFKELTWLHLGNNKIADISLLDEMLITSVRVNEQDITINTNTRSIDLPKLLIQARDKNSIGYTENEFIFQNCSLSEDGTKLIIDEGALTARVEIKDEVNDWSLAGSRITIKFVGDDDKTPPEDNKNDNDNNKHEEQVNPENPIVNPEDPTIAKEPMPDTGKNIIKFISFILIIVVGIISLSKYKYLKNILNK